MHSQCYLVMNYNYCVLQLSVSNSVAERQYHSMTALYMGPHCVWLLVFGGYPNIADTTIIELSEYNKNYNPDYICLV